ncbi:cysteine dioxygenase family protein [Ramlibacter sp.]|uniref:cysteine dioxygenase n=1 Tax=Ramlibacter sp. TaxID=1917967 RepID=UPI0017C6B719|nr:cysteine dioxygenase family protein [Ramlibacter sp.]MBA2676516.1 cysteine dioxygenase family protein [Ramlibacter sp.]
MTQDVFSDETLARVAAEVARVGGRDIAPIGQLLADLGGMLPEVRRARAIPEGEPYWRAPLYRTDALEIVQMVFGPKQEWLPHDHGRSPGWVYVLSGEAEHVLYEFQDDGTLHEERREMLAEGSLTFMPEGLIHTLGPAADRLSTIFAYAPPIKGMGVYDPAAGCGCIVSDDCGAWWPTRPDHMVRQFRFPASNPTESTKERTS